MFFKLRFKKIDFIVDGYWLYGGLVVYDKGRGRGFRERVREFRV